MEARSSTEGSALCNLATESSDVGPVALGLIRGECPKVPTHYRRLLIRESAARRSANESLFSMGSDLSNMTPFITMGQSFHLRGRLDGTKAGVGRVPAWNTA